MDTEIIVDDDEGGRLSLVDLANQDDEDDEEDDADDDEVLDTASLNRMRKTDLVDLASSLGKESSGTKADIIARLVA